tara:strand:+ start:153 stop:410 length:258 start_codon:yes stop_codon:yes gene_type:complete
MSNIVRKWNDKAEEVLLKRRITHVEYMSTEEAKDYMWYKRPVVMYLDNGTRLIIQSDDEGNDGGALWYGTSENQDVLPVLGLEDE